MKSSHIIGFALILTAFLSTGIYGQKLKLEDVVAKHLESIGTQDARTKTKTLIAVGNGNARLLSTKDQETEGRLVIASDGPKFFLGMNLKPVGSISDEMFKFDGNTALAARPQRGSPSPLRNFIQSYLVMIDQGLLGGELSTGWLMENIATNKGKLSLNGIKKIGGKELYAIEYSKKGGGDLDITMYFDKETFRHVRTEYRRIASASIGVKPEDSSKFSETRYKVVEEFGDHRAEGGLMLPHTYRIVYSIEGQNGTTEIEWKFVLNEFAVNQRLDPGTFTSSPVTP